MIEVEIHHQILEYLLAGYVSPYQICLSLILGFERSEFGDEFSYNIRIVELCLLVIIIGSEFFRLSAEIVICVNGTLPLAFGSDI